MSKKLEIEMLYGQLGYAQIASVSGPTLTIVTAEWAPGIWAGAEAMPIEIRSNDGTTSRGEFVVKSVDMTARTVTLTTTPSGITTSPADVIWHKGAFGNEFPGIHKILTISSGTLFNIDVGTYNLFRGNTYDALSAALSFTKLQSAAARAVEKGLDTDLYCLINPRAWANMMSDQAALRRYDDSYSATTVENGGKTIKFHSQNGTLEIEPSIYIKEGGML